MPIVIPKEMPAYRVLTDENIFVMSSKRAHTQDIRPLEIALVNLMPTKAVTETQLMRLLGNTPLQVNITCIKMMSHVSKNTSAEHLDKFYQNFEEVKNRRFDGMVITGAPVETLDFTEVHYWEELQRILDFAEKNVTSTIFICWGAQAALYYYFGVEKITLSQKLFGIYPNRAVKQHELLLKGMDDEFFIPMSRHTHIREEQLKTSKQLEILAAGEKGVSILKTKDNRKFFFMGHAEYDRETLDLEYRRDLEKGLPISPPENYYTDETKTAINFRWASTGNLLFYNWLNYYVYQVTPYIIDTAND